MHLTRQLMAALLWYKRFAQSILDVKPADIVKDANLTPGPEAEASSVGGEVR
jgi:hypothetical protein